MTEVKTNVRMAIIEIQCPHCSKPTKAILPDTINLNVEQPEVKCEKCGKTFTFTAGMLYRPIGYAN